MRGYGIRPNVQISEFQDSCSDFYRIFLRLSLFEEKKSGYFEKMSVLLTLSLGSAGMVPNRDWVFIFCSFQFLGAILEKSEKIAQRPNLGHSWRTGTFNRSRKFFSVGK